MAYCTSADLTISISTTEVGRLTNDLGGITINSLAVDDAISKADKYINLKCRGTHTVPWTVTPEPIGWISVDLSIRNLYERRPDLEATKSLMGRWKRAEKLLTEIANGDLKIDDDTSFSNTAGIWASNKTTSSKVYTGTYLDTF